MTTGRDAGRVVGLAVSLGIGLGIVVGGLGAAAADSGDSGDSGDSSTSADRLGADGATTRTATRSVDSSDGDGRDAELGSAADRPERATDSSIRDATTESTDPTDDVAESDVTESADRTASIDDVAESAERAPSIDDVAEAADYGAEDRSVRRSTARLTRKDTPSAQLPELPETAAAPSTDDTSPSPAPVQTQAVPVMVAAARRQSLEDKAGATAAPVLIASVADPNPLSGATLVTVAAADPDTETLNFTATRPTLGRVVGDGTGNFTYTPTTFARVLARFLPFLRSDGFSVTATNAHGSAASVRVNTTVVPINSAPRAGPVTVGAPDAPTGVVTGKADATDPNRDSLTFLAVTSVTAKGSVSVRANGTFTYTPTAEARHRAAAASATTGDKTDTFAVSVADNFGARTDIAVTVRISPANGLPTGITHVDEPDPGSGEVNGRISGLDPDGDTVVYRGPDSTLKGSVVVHTDGTFTYTPTADAQYYAAHAYALPYDRSDSFDVTLDDGHGGVTTVPVSVVISPGDQAVTAPPLSTFCGCTLLPADTIFHADLRGLPAMSESDTWIELLGGNRGATLRASWAGSEWMGSTGGMPVNVVDADHPKENVVFNRGYSTSGPGIDNRPYAIPDRPLVEGMPSYPAWDRHLLVFQKGTCISQELYNVANGVELPGAGVLDILGNAAYAAIWGSSWIAEAGAQYDMSSPLYPAIGHANASRLPYLPMILRPDDLERGYIDHMLGIAIAKDVGAGYVWPARAGDGSAADGIPMGTVLRLRADVDISQYAQSTQTILRALQVHGAVVFDSKGPGTDGANLLAMSNGWDGTDYVTAKSELNTIAINLFEAVDAASLAADPATSWQIR